MRILACSLGSPGFLFPLLGLAQELERRGHTVTFLSSQAMAATVRQAGFSLCGTSERAFEVGEWWIPAIAILQMKWVEKAIAEEAPDLLLTCDLFLGGGLAAERNGIPRVVLGLNRYLFPRIGAEPSQRQAWHLRERLAAVQRAREPLDMPELPQDAWEQAILGDRYLLRNIAELETGEGRLPEPVRCVGACLWEPADSRMDPELETWLETVRSAHRPLLYVCQGRTFHVQAFWPLLQEMLEAEGLAAVASLNRFEGKWSEGAAEESYRARPHVPQGLVLPWAEAIVASGTSTAVLGALKYKVPMLLIPAGSEQVDVANAFEAAGLAIRLPAEQLGEDTLRRDLQRLLNDGELHARVRRVGDKFAAFPGFEVAADVTEGAVSRRNAAIAESAS